MHKEVLSIKDSIATDVKNMMVTNSADSMGKAPKKMLGTIAMVSALTPGVFARSGADQFFNNFAEVLKRIFTAISGVVHIFAASLLGVAILIRLISKNPRSIEEANAWIKNIIISWIAFYSISVLVRLMDDFKAPNWKNPWTNSRG